MAYDHAYPVFIAMSWMVFQYLCAYMFYTNARIGRLSHPLMMVQLFAFAAVDFIIYFIDP
jgi:hypothetical protein